MSKAPTRKSLVGQKKPMAASGSSPLLLSNKKQKVSGVFLDQPIELLNDVTAVSGINLRNEEEQLFSGPKQDYDVSKASQNVFHEEEERLILHRIPLRKRILQIMARSGLQDMSDDLEQSLSLFVEDRLRVLIADLIRLSKQRVNTEKPQHRTIITSDIRQQIMAINCEELEKKQAQTKDSLKPNEPESSSRGDGNKEKDKSGRRSAKSNKVENYKVDKKAVNEALRDTTGVDDVTSRWQQMVEAKRKQGGISVSSPTQPATASFALFGKDVRNQVLVPDVARSIMVKDVIAVLEREPQMSKSTLMYELYDKVKC